MPTLRHALIGAFRVPPAGAAAIGALAGINCLLGFGRIRRFPVELGLVFLPLLPSLPKAPKFGFLSMSCTFTAALPSTASALGAA